MNKKYTSINFFEIKASVFLVSFIFLFIGSSSGQSFDWAKDNEGTANSGLSIAVHPSGSIYVTGEFNGTVDFDPSLGTFNLTSTGGIDVFIQKLDGSGNLLWARSIGGPSSQSVNCVVVDPSGNSYITGFYSGTCDFDPSLSVYNLTSAGGSDIFVLKLDASGNFVWAESFGGTSGDMGRSLTLDAFGNIYVTGDFKLTADFDPSVSVFNLTSAGSADAFFIKLNNSGNLLWAKSIGGTYTFGDAGRGICVDPFNNIVISGWFGGTVDFDPSVSVFNLTSAGSADPFIEKLDASGNFIWAKAMGGALSESSLSVITDASGNIYSTGELQGTADLDPSTGVFNLTAVGSTDVYIQKLDASGNFLWAKSYGGPSLDQCNQIILDSLNNIYAAGHFLGTCDFDPSLGTFNLTSAGSADIFIQKLDPSGNLVWAKSMGGTAGDYGFSLALDQNANIYSTGWFSDSVDFNPSTAQQDTFFLYSSSDNTFIHKMYQDSCASIALIIDSLYNVSCSGLGRGHAFTLHGLPPYSYSWTTIPVDYDSIADFTSGGIYSLTVTDANTCIRTTSLLVDGPPNLTGFDLNANVLASPFRPGFQAAVWINAFNDGCVSMNGQLKLVLDPLVNYSSAVPVPNLISGDTLIWDFSNLAYDSTHFVPCVFLNTSLSAQIGDTICFDQIITPSLGDADTTNNLKHYCFPVVNGYDPNIKNVYPTGECNGYVLNDQMLTYTIQFQNTGNSEAINIHVLDSLDSDLDLNSVRVVGNSHNLITEVMPNQVLNFHFNNIMLPDSNNNEPQSHGYVIFQVKPLPNLLNGTIVKNRAKIYFDYNPAVITNTVLNTLLDTIIPLSTIVSQGNATLTAMGNGLNYQWVDCNNGYSPIVGETNQTFSPTVNGNYAVIVNNNTSCSDTSSCYSISNVGMNENNSSFNFSVFPNPNKGIVSLTINNGPCANYSLEILSIEGKSVYTINFSDLNSNTKKIIDVRGLESGIYFLQLKCKESVLSKKFIKE